VVSAPRDRLVGWRAGQVRAEAPIPGTAHAEAVSLSARAPAKVGAPAHELAAFAEEAVAALPTPDPERDTEGIVMAEHDAGAPTADPDQPGDRDPLRDGLWVVGRSAGAGPL